MAKGRCLTERKYNKNNNRTELEFLYHLEILFFNTIVNKICVRNVA